MVKKIYFAGGAFGMIYQMGALSAVHDETALNDKYIFYGCSAGALTAVMTLLGYTDKEMLDIYDDISKRTLDKISKEPYKYDTYNLTPHHFEVLKMVNKDHPDAYKILTKKKLHVGVTLETGFRWFRKFRSNKELFNILLCSFHVPFLCSYNAIIDGANCIDGCFGFDADQHLPPDTLIICPKHTESSRFDVLNGGIPVKFCATPPPIKERLQYYKQGFKDMRQYIKTGKCATTTSGKIDEAIVPNSFWWLLRRLQPDDKEYTLSNIFHNQTF